MKMLMLRQLLVRYYVHVASEYGSGGGSDDPQKLRDEILYHQPSRHSSPRQDRGRIPELVTID